MKNFCTLLFLFLIPCLMGAQETKNYTNFVIIFLDDAGWEDFQPFGADHFQTPQVKKLASEGSTFSQFYVPQAICSASRAALLSGSYPHRTNVFGAQDRKSVV